MKIAGFVVLMLGMLLGPAYAEQPELPAWLEGSWKLTTGGSAVEEHWTSPSDGMMMGMSRSVSNGKLKSFEFLRIQVQGSDLVYLAQPQGRPATEFKLTQHSDSELIFANPQHDFPKRIIYRRQSSDRVLARIEDDKGQGRDFAYERVK
jgi:hypothetical protein